MVDRRRDWSHLLLVDGLSSASENRCIIDISILELAYLIAGWIRAVINRACTSSLDDLLHTKHVFSAAEACFLSIEAKGVTRA